MTFSLNRRDRHLLFIGILFFSFISGCQSANNVAGEKSGNISEPSLGNAVKISFLSPARDARTGETFVLYQVLLSRSWCKLKGRDISDEFTNITTPAVAFDIDDGLMNEFREFMIKRDFLKLPDYHPDIRELQRISPFPTILSLETPTAKKIVAVSELPRDQQTIRSIGEIEQYFFAVADKFPPTQLKVNIMK